jgi:hypothetical protein
MQREYREPSIADDAAGQRLVGRLWGRPRSRVPRAAVEAKAASSTGASALQSA